MRRDCQFKDGKVRMKALKDWMGVWMALLIDQTREAGKNQFTESSYHAKELGFYDNNRKPLKGPQRK